ncbi:DUF2262 domain-containing protein [Gallaecimonas pentaromativorans]|uniref:Uncharacterized protein n=1 Tax=Gallaecimonas pentaromativorans TaxID=584787 RepID=A0A3N1PL20_9GAMM|nr:DUF2262 domain-containing protein [Gallaecimonas pentaromativorans]ROQ28829.1 hypothetical protein EDC28_103426 [Gallaecimonas pentaromativorans]
MEDIFKEAAIKKEKLEKEFVDLPETIITGVVGANGPGAGKVPSDKYWSLNLSLIAWKELGGQINDSKLILSKNLADGELEDIRANVERESLVQFAVKLSKNSPFGDARAQLISILDTPDDAELKAVLEKFKEPVEITHPEFGTLVLDRSVDWFEGTMNWMGEQIRISASLDREDGSPDSSLKTLEALCGDASNWSKKITDYAVSELLELKNDNWLMDGQGELTASDFTNAMKLESITVYPDGEFDFWHNDGDLFWGHSILISGTLSEGPNNADIPG